MFPGLRFLRKDDLELYFPWIIASLDGCRLGVSPGNISMSAARRVACLLAFREVSPGCRLIGTASMLDWLRLSPAPSLTGEQYAKMEPNYPRGWSLPERITSSGGFNVPLYF